jgi:hypothetical protein
MFVVVIAGSMKRMTQNLAYASATLHSLYLMENHGDLVAHWLTLTTEGVSFSNHDTQHNATSFM